jgi:RNA polymerase-binding transcription factor DksA
MPCAGSDFHAAARREEATRVTVEHDMFFDHYRRRLLLLERVLAQHLGNEFALGCGSAAGEPLFADAPLAGARTDAAFTLAETEGAVLVQIRAALQRIDEGTFGCCVVDGNPIDPKRLESVPWTPFCVVHQLELELRARARPAPAL